MAVPRLGLSLWADWDEAPEGSSANNPAYSFRCTYVPYENQLDVWILRFVGGETPNITAEKLEDASKFTVTYTLRDAATSAFALGDAPTASFALRAIATATYSLAYHAVEQALHQPCSPAQPESPPIRPVPTQYAVVGCAVRQK